MAAANESQGLKIAVAAFVTLSVILAVTSYFLYSAYSRSEALMESEKDKASKAQSAATERVKEYDEFRKLAGARAEEIDPARAEVTGFLKKMDDRIGNLVTTVNAAVAHAKAAGATGPELDDAMQKIQTTINSYRAEPNKNFIGTQDRLVELLESLTLLGTELSANYVGLRRSLESSNTNAKQQIDVQAKAASDNKADLEGEQKKHVELRQDLMASVDRLQTDNQEKAAQIANLETKYRQLQEDSERRVQLANTIIRELRDLIGQTENVLDKPDGYVTYVDLERNEVHVDVNRHQGARPQMKFTIFGAGSPGIPTERPKGNVELIQVGDRYSIAEIRKVSSSIDPIRVGDIVYSPAWSPEKPMRFALIGRIDINRDGKDDRQDLKRLIEDAGGAIDFDLPPPEYGKESGKLTARVDWYVIDDRAPLREVYQAKSDATLRDQADYQKRYGQAIKDARLEGIRPMPVSRLLAYLGYEMGSPIVGRAEAVNSAALRQLVQPRPKTQATKPAAETDAAKTEEPKPEAEEPKPEEPKPEEKPQ
jgi:hypothetical protein